MTELELQQRIKDETFISSTAWVFLILAGTVLYWSAVGGGMMQLVLEVQNRTFLDPPGGIPGEFTERIQRAQMQALFVLAILAIGGVLLIVTSIVVLKRRNWGRVLMTVSIFVLVAVLLFLALYIGSLYFRQLQALSVKIPGEDGFGKTFQLASKLQYLSYGLFSIIICWLMLRAAIKLNRPRIRALFS
ncbi:MAG: hypothetical protein AAFY48_03685 [Bacteroidota bacterium]